MQKVRNLVDSIRNYRSFGKTKFDSYADQAFLWAAGNSAYFLAAERGLNAIAQNAESGEGLAMAAGYLAGTAGAVALNRNVLPKLSHKLKDHYQAKLARRAQSTALSWVKTAGLAGLLGAAALYGDKHDAAANVKSDFSRVIHAFERPGTAQPAYLDTTGVQVVEEEPVKPDNTKAVVPGPLTGRNMADLYAHITGIYGVVPESPKVDFEQQLQRSWNIKNKREDLTDVARQTGVILNQEYDNNTATKMSLNEYIEEANKTVLEKRGALDWDKIQESRGMSTRERELAESISNSITGCHLMTYYMTELLPSPAGQQNIAVFDFVLRNAGREYLESFPAIHDGYTSFGPAQFTQFALYNAKGKLEGASRINQALPYEHRIPDSVSMLRGNDHHGAAYLFATDNIVSGVQSLSRADFAKLEAGWKEHFDDVLKYIATAHHGPGNARGILRKWLSKGIETDYTDAARTYRSKYYGPKSAARYTMYSIKTAANNNALGCD